jgi:hypothetical protein
MASNIQLATTLVAPTGTGLLFIPWSIDGNRTVYKQSGASGRPAELSFSRVLPKPAGASLGVERCEVKLTEFVTVSDIEHRVITALTSAVPVPVGTTQRTDQSTRMGLLAYLATYRDTVISQSIPV